MRGATENSSETPLPSTVAKVETPGAVVSMNDAVKMPT
jgi:hypothetical protein